MDGYELAGMLFGSNRVEGSESVVDNRDMTVYGVARQSEDGRVYVQFTDDVTLPEDDGLEHDTYIELPSEVYVEDGDEVAITLSGGVMSSPRVSGVIGGGDRINVRIKEIESDYVKATRLEADVAAIGFLQASSAVITSLQADTAKVHNLTADQLSAATAYISALTAGSVTAQDITANVAKVKDLTADQLSAATAYIADLVAGNVTAQSLTADVAKVHNLTADQLSAATAYIAALAASNVTAQQLAADHAKIGDLDATYAQIDLANVTNAWIENGVVRDAAISDAQIVGVSANKLTAGEIDATNVHITNLQAKNIKVERINGVSVTGKSVADALAAAESEIDGVQSDVSALDSRLDGAVADLNARVDAQIETFTTKAVPTLNNYPASSWGTDKLRSEHVGDICYVVNAGSEADGYTYRFAYDEASGAYGWVLIKDNQVTAALKRLQDAEGNISGLQEFQTETASWIDETDEGLRTIRQSHTTLSGVVDKTVKSSVQLWYSKANTTAPAAPTAKVTSTSTSGNAWRAVVPAYNATYPNYFYCWQYEYADGTYGWSAVVRDIAMGESQATARTAASDATTAKSTADAAASDAATAKSDASTAKSTAEGAATDAATAKTDASAAKTTATTAKTTADAAKAAADASVKSHTMLWFSKANTTGPSKPTAKVTSTSTAGNAWRVVVPTWSATYPHYFYCYQFEQADGTIRWGDVVYDSATSEAQQRAAAALPAATFETFESTTFKELVDEVDEQSSTITTLTESTRTALSQGTEYVVGTQTASTNAWTGKTQDASIYAGKTIAYKLPYAGTSTAATLNLTLSGGGTTGAKGVYCNNSTVTTQFAAGSVIQMTYDGTYWRVTGMGSDTTTNYYDREAYKASVTASGAIAAARIGVFGTDGKLKLLAASAFDTSYPILYVGTAYTDSALTQTNNYTFWGTAFALTNTHAIKGAAAGRPVYVVGTMDGKVMTPTSDVLTCTEPTSADGLFYLRLGLMSTAANAVLESYHPIYAYVGGKFQQATESVVSATNTVNTVKQTADSNSAKITSLETVNSKNGLTASTNITSTVNSVKQTADANKSSITSLETVNTKNGLTSSTNITQRTSDLEQDLSGFKSTVSATYATQSALTTEANQRKAQYGSCATAAATPAKAVTISNFALYTGATVTVRFEKGNTAAAPTLNVSSTGAKPIVLNNTASPTATQVAWSAYATCMFTYDGSQWRLVSTDEDVKRISAAETSISQNADAIALRATRTEVERAALASGVEYIAGTQTAATNAWTGVTAEDSLATGKTIAYRLPYAGNSSAATLNLTLAGGGTTGAKAIKMPYSTSSNTAALSNVTTHWPVGSVIQMTYDGTQWVISNYNTNVNTNNYDRRLHNNAVLAAAAVTAAHLIAGTASGYRQLAASLAFDVAYPVLYASAAIAANATAATTYEAYPSVNFSTTGTIQSGAANKMLWLKGALSGSTFTIATSNWLTTVTPTTADGMFYVPLGVLANATTGYFSTSDQLYAFLDGKFQRVDLSATTRVTAAEASIRVNADNIESKVSKDGVISSINQSAETVKIQASRVEVDGTAVFNAAKSKLDAAYDAKGAASAVQTNLDNLQVGGRNLLLYSDTPAKYRLNTPAAYNCYNINMSENFVKGDTYTLQVWGTIGRSDKSGTAIFNAYWGGGNVSLGAMVPNAARDYWTLTFTAPNNTHASTANAWVSLYNTVPVGASGVTYSSTITKAKLEKGNRATDWTPAPEDVDASVESAVNAAGGFDILWNRAEFGSDTNAGGECYLCAFDPTTATRTDANGWAMWNGTKRTITKGMFNPNAVLPYNIPIYIVCRLSSATATTGTNYMVWYDGSWKSGPMSPSASTVAAWTWAEATDMVLGKFVEPGSEVAFTECETYRQPLKWGAITTDTVTARSANAAAAAAQTTANTANTTANAANNKLVAFRGVCSTAAGTAAKVVACTGFALTQGYSITVYNTMAQTVAGAITLNVNSLGAKNVWVAGAVTSDTNRLLWAAGSTVTFVYDGTQFRVADNPPSLYGTTCTIAEGTAAKTTTANECVIFKGASITVPMSNSNTATSPTLNVTSLGASAIYYGSGTTGPTKANGFAWPATAAVIFTFDGKFWRCGNQTFIDGGNILTGTIAADRIKANVISAVNNGTGTINADKINASALSIGYSQLTGTPTIPSKTSQLSNDSGFATTAQAQGYANTVQSNLDASRSWYAECPTAAATTAKVATISPATTAFTTSTLTPGTVVHVKFSYTNSGAVGSITLNVNSTGAKPIKYIASGGNVANIPSAGYLIADRTYEFYYDGTNWVVQMPYNTDNYDRENYKAALAASAAISAARVAVLGTDKKLKTLAASAFDSSGPILYVATAYSADDVTAGTTRTTNYTFWGTAFALTSTHSIAGAAAGKPVYIVGTLSGTTFTPNSTVLTCTVPTSADGLVYIRLGLMSTAANAVLESDHPMYMYYDGAFQQCDPATASAATKATAYITHVDNNGITVHPSSTTNNRVAINASGMEVFKGNASVAMYGDTARIGKTGTGNKNVFVDSEGVHIRDNETDIAEFSATSTTSSLDTVYESILDFKGNGSGLINVKATRDVFSSSDGNDSANIAMIAEQDLGFAEVSLSSYKDGSSVLELLGDTTIFRDPFGYHGELQLGAPEFHQYSASNISIAAGIDAGATGTLATGIPAGSWLIVARFIFNTGNSTGNRAVQGTITVNGNNWAMQRIVMGGANYCVVNAIDMGTLTGSWNLGYKMSASIATTTSKCSCIFNVFRLQ